MRLSELAHVSGVSIPSIKFYLRGGLLAPGRPLSKTQADYDESHVERLRLIRALREVGQLPIATIQAILAAVDDPNVPDSALMGLTHDAVARPVAPVGETGRAAARTLLDDLGWELAPDSPLIDSLGSVLQVLIAQGQSVDAKTLGPWAEAAYSVATVELERLPLDAHRAQTANVVAIGTVLYGELLRQLRLAAQSAIGRTRFGEHESGRVS